MTRTLKKVVAKFILVFIQFKVRSLRMSKTTSAGQHRVTKITARTLAVVRLEPDTKVTPLGGHQGTVLVYS